ncbi:MAG: hypothetical protein IKF16_02180 [Lachnospiraceae bacterium]|nr:hypothetical protein [Lachnospiraceae bacterium]
MGKTGKQELWIGTVTEADAPPDYHRTARKLYERCLAFYQDPENEKAYQEWRKERENHQRVAV